MNLLSFLAAGVIMVHCTCLIAKLNHRNWYGHKLQFVGLSAAYALIGGGAVGIALGYPPAIMLLLFGEAARVVFDRRERI